ncbi:hypothetical protein Bpfe_015521 [Biomphalaria pfeifferi]|uniref:Uncharacterized protein n=1 Tax=Biomphalaria pfeifferi TaxID=112525 RepID=A0AAD8BK02_BIOPF|nr:hypothetical protein Bpfe_015521 [Biomphalaria pfeifferi]
MNDVKITVQPLKKVDEILQKHFISFDEGETNKSRETEKRGDRKERRQKREETDKRGDRKEKTEKRGDRKEKTEK